MVFPAPVSPVSAVKPGANRKSAWDITPKLVIDSWSIMAYPSERQPLTGSWNLCTKRPENGVSRIRANNTGALPLVACTIEAGGTL